MKMKKIKSERSVALLLTVVLFLVISLLIIGIGAYMNNRFFSTLHSSDKSTSFYFASMVAQEGVYKLRDAEPIIEGESYKGVDIDGDGEVDERYNKEYTAEGSEELNNKNLEGKACLKMEKIPSTDMWEIKVDSNLRRMEGKMKSPKNIIIRINEKTGEIETWKEVTVDQMNFCH